MALFVRVRNRSRLRAAVDAALGSQADVAERAGMPPSRLNQLLTGNGPQSIRLGQAARLEDALHVARGDLFELDAPGDVDVSPYLIGLYGAGTEAGVA